MNETCTPSVILSFLIFSLAAAIFYEPESEAEPVATPEVVATAPQPVPKPVGTPTRPAADTKPFAPAEPALAATVAPTPTALVTPAVPEPVSAPIVPIVPVVAAPVVSASPSIARSLTVAASDPVVPRSQSPQVSHTSKPPIAPGSSPKPTISPVRTSRVSLAGRASSRPGLIREQAGNPRTEFTTVRKGEALSDVAIRIYGGPEFTRSLWRANREQLERIDTPLRPGNLLRTPSLD